MKIRDIYTTAASGVSRVRRRKGIGSVEGAPAPASGADRAEFSKRSYEVQKARVLAIQAPDIREDLVTELFDQINQGRYLVRGSEVAPRMIQEHLMDART
jgi:anti-sigma28 factor (negative regulator of flagellin synthesis)